MSDNTDKMQALKQGQTILVGNNIFMICKACKQIIRMNKFIIGSLHFCVGEDE